MAGVDGDAEAAAHPTAHLPSLEFLVMPGIMKANPVSEMEIAVKYTVFEYMYRDGSNYKTCENLLLKGSLDEGILSDLRACFDVDDRFIPDYVGVMPLQFRLCRFGGPTEYDHPLHEFTGSHEASPEEVEKLELWGTVEELVAAMKREAPRWR